MPVRLHLLVLEIGFVDEQGDDDIRIDIAVIPLGDDVGQRVGVGCAIAAVIV